MIPSGSWPEPTSARTGFARQVAALAVASATCVGLTTACAAEPVPEAAVTRIEEPRSEAPSPPAAEPAPEVPAGSAVSAAAPVEELIVDVVSSHPHDPTAFTQGLLWSDGVLYESTGQYGQSTVRRVDPETGKVLARTELPPELFGEGLALVPGERDGRLIQLTWQEQVARVWSLSGLEPVASFPYRGEGWGLCFDGERLVMSDGSDVLTFRDPDTFEETGRVRVTLRGEPLHRLNELECVDGSVWANVLGAEHLVRIDPVTGRVTATAAATGLLAPVEAIRADVLNGIAYDPERRVFLITGKYWPRLFVVRLIPARGPEP